MIRRPPRSTLDRSSAASDVYKRQVSMRPSRTIMSPGPTCFHPVRSLPLKRGFQSASCACEVANKEQRMRMAKKIRFIEVEISYKRGIVHHPAGCGAAFEGRKARLAAEGAE